MKLIFEILANFTLGCIFLGLFTFVGGVTFLVISAILSSIKDMLTEKDVPHE